MSVSISCVNVVAAVAPGRFVNVPNSSMNSLLKNLKFFDFLCFVMTIPTGISKKAYFVELACLIATSDFRNRLACSQLPL